ncbi:MAG: endo-1,3-alpha-glucanase family glycosylhydrolase [Candidatus Sulfotelmatobacter sp.]
MPRTHFAAVLLLALPMAGWASNSYVVPNTTLTAQTANNTSAANSFQTQPNGNLGANNVSKVDVHTLLYSGASTKVFAHMLLWFGEPNHMNIGYSSTDANQVQSQIDDMVSRGIDGVVIDWYGPNNSIDQATQLVRNAAEQHPGFTFAIMVDAAAIGQNMCSGCSTQQTLTQLLQYVEQKYFTSSAYFTIDGQPVVTSFNIDLSYSIDWNSLNASVSTHPRFLFQDNQGFGHILSDGSYSWVMPQLLNYGLSYLSSFYWTGMNYPNLETVGAAYKGFNDSLASWGTGRVMSQQCGQTWLQAFSEANRLYGSGKQLPYMQLVTWNDYEEATEIESGIDNCFSLSGSLSGNTLQWSIGGDENTIDHYNVYVSTDGQNLMTLTQTATGMHSVNLCSFPIPAGNYSLFVQAVGKPSMANRIPGPVSYSPSCTASAPSGGSSASSSFTASPATLTLSAGNSGQVTVTASSQAAPNDASISLSCDFLPANLMCAFSPATITPGIGTATSTLTITNSVQAAINSPRRSGAPWYATWLFSFGAAGFVLIGNVQKLRKGLVALLFCGLVAVMLNTSCGGGGKTSAQNSGSANAAATYTVSVLGTSGPNHMSASVVVTVP